MGKDGEISLFLLTTILILFKLIAVSHERSKTKHGKRVKAINFLFDMTNHNAVSYTHLRAHET